MTAGLKAVFSAALWKVPPGRERAPHRHTPTPSHVRNFGLSVCLEEERWHPVSLTRGYGTSSCHPDTHCAVA